MVYISGYNPIAMLEALINALIQKGIFTMEEAEEIADKGKQPGT